MKTKLVGVVYNDCYGGFELCPEAFQRYCDLKRIPCYLYKAQMDFRKPLTKIKSFEDTHGKFFIYYPLSKDFGDSIQNIETVKEFYIDKEISRNDQTLVQVVREFKELHKEAGGGCSKLEIEFLKGGSLYRINEYDGKETVVLAENEKWETA